MKKSIFFCAALLASALGFQSCDKVDNPGEPTVKPAPVYNLTEEFVYDFAAEQVLIADGKVEKPANFGGGTKTGQEFYGWEKSDKTDSKRTDYKGWNSLKEGSQLPAVCHVWRRSDRYDQEASWTNAGGLTCPNDREYAIDGVDKDSYVQIFYTAAKDEDQIIWAIGDGSGAELEGPRTTATINGVEAVTGETVISSGATIIVNSVTPAVNGTGYIVVKVKKNMIISKIVIGKATIANV